MIKFPQQGTPIIQAPKGNLQGSLWSTFGVDLKSNPGRIRLGDKLNTITTSADDADLGLPSAFAMDGGAWWAVCGTKVFRSDDSSAPLGEVFTQDTKTNTPAACDPDISDLALFNGRLWVTEEEDLLSSDGYASVWTVRKTMSGFQELHKMAYLASTDRLYITNQEYSIISIDRDDVVADSPGSYYIEFGEDVEIATMVATSSQIFVSLPATGFTNTAVTKPFNHGVIAIWDGISSQVTTSIELDSSGMMAMAVKNDIVYGVDSRGRFMKFNGYGFDEIGRLPFGILYPVRSAEVITNGVSKHIHYNGLAVTDDNTLVALINGRLTTQADPLLTENVQSGVWECDIETGSVTHKHPLSYKGHQSSTITDFGQIRIHAAGALALQVHPRGVTSSTIGRTDIICGASYYTDSGVATADASAIFLSSPRGNAGYLQEGEKRGYFVTTWIDSSDMQDTWQKIGIKHRKYLDSDDKIVVKYRTTEADPTYANITWTSTTTFTTTTDISSYWTSGTGGEVEITQGPGGGVCAHITSIVNNAGTYTVTIDEIATGVSNGNTAIARFQAWVKIAALTLQNLESEVNALGVSSERIQFKVVMHFTGDGEFHQMQVSNKPHIKLD